MQRNPPFRPTSAIAILILGLFLSTAVFGQPSTTPYNDHSVTAPSVSGSSSVTASGTPTDDVILTDEERELITMKLLPRYYPMLKQAMEKPFGSLERAKAKARSLYRYPNAVYSPRFGDPVHMLDWARRYRGDAAMVKFCASTVRGDIILTGHRTEEGQKNDMIAILTGGKYHHAVTVIDGPPCVFIEAVGLTGTKSDPTNNRVRLASWHEQLASWAGMRLLRPTAGLPTAQANRYIEGAVQYLVDQLGKPYDYGFTNNDVNRAFYCSELAWKSYYEGGGMKSFKPVKSSERDRMVVALNAVVDGLRPKDRVALANRVMTFTGEYLAQKPPDLKKLNNFIVDEIVPGCGLCSDAFPTPEAREKLRTVLEKVRNNQAFTSYLKAREDYLAAEKAGKFKTGWGIGAARKLAAEMKIAGSIAADINAMVKEAGAGYAKTVKLVSGLIGPIYKHLGTYTDFMTGMNKEGKMQLPDGAKTVLSITDWLAKKREQVKNWPIGSSLANLLPGYGDDKVQTSFTSPTDLANTSPNFHLDYP